MAAASNFVKRCNPNFEEIYIVKTEVVKGLCHSKFPHWKYLWKFIVLFSLLLIWDLTDTSVSLEDLHQFILSGGQTTLQNRCIQGSTFCQLSGVTVVCPGRVGPQIAGKMLLEAQLFISTGHIFNVDTKEKYRISAIHRPYYKNSHWSCSKPTKTQILKIVNPQVLRHRVITDCNAHSRGDVLPHQPIKRLKTRQREKMTI